MFFQISPVHKIEKKPVKNATKNESEEITELSLAPFTANSKVAFEDIRVGSVANRKLLIKNPNKYDIELDISHNFPDELNIILSWSQQLVKADTETLLEITWTPQCEGSWRYILNVEGSRHIHKSVPVAFKSTVPKVSKPGAKTKNAKITRRLSPKKLPGIKRTIKKFPGKKACFPTVSDLPTITVCTPLMERPKCSEKENIDKSKMSPLFLSPSNVSFHYETKNTCERRETYTLTTHTYVPKVLSSSTLHNINLDLPKERRDTYTVKFQNKERSDTTFDDSLEMTTPTKNIQNKTTYIQAPVIPDNIFSSKHFSSLCFSPLSTPQQKSDDFRTYVGRGMSPKQTTEFHDGIESPSMLFANKNSTFRLDNSSPLLNLSTETYVKGNLSTETYIKGNISSETYTKANTSSSTYVKDTSVGDLASLPVSPQSYRVQDSAQNAYFIGSNRTSPQFDRKLFSNERGFKDNFDNDAYHLQNKNRLGSIIEESFRTDNTNTENNTIYKKTLKRRSNMIVNTVSPKKLHLEDDKKRQENNLSWSKKSTPLRITKKTSGLHVQYSGTSTKHEGNKEVTITVKDTHQIDITNPFILAATSTIDPFMTSTLYFDEAWVEEQEKNFKKWLNMLLTPPEELDSNVEGPTVNVAKLWQQCRKTEVAEAPTRETISAEYHTDARLNSLRKLARSFFMTSPISNVLTRVNLAVENEKLLIRKDRDIHLDLSLQSEIMSLFLSYNPLWLRIGLETIYNIRMPLNSNSDVIGLSKFIMERFFRDPYLLKKFVSTHSPKYTDHLKKFMLKKFLILVYFLDQAKTRKLISHDPCLFCKNAPVKESREILFNFAKNALFAIGDITKYLKLLGYVVTHKQTYIHEYNYGVKNLGTDLRDGVRLTRVMEIILLKDGLKDKLRVPAISRLQKVHNTKVAFDALVNAGGKIMQEIEPKDLVDGHKEKTLSFLWQLIYKFEAPLMVKNVTIIQKWWRSLGIQLKRNKLRRTRILRESSAEKIQKWYRRQKLSSKLNMLHEWLVKFLEDRRRQKAAVTIQRCFRMYIAKKRYVSLRQTVIILQAYARRWLYHNYYNTKIKAAIKIQSYIKMYLTRKKFLKIKYAVLTIETHYTAYKQMMIEKEKYDNLRYSVLLIQSIYRANLLMKNAREEYLTLKSAAVVIQRRFRAKRMMLYVRQEYTMVRYATLTIQTWYRATKLMRDCRMYYKKLKYSAQVIKERYLAKKLMRIEVDKYQKLRHSVIICQQRFRAQIQMKIHKEYFYKLKQSAITIQNRYRAKILSRIERNKFIQLRKSVIICQNRFRANRDMKLERDNFLKLKNAALVIQQRYKAHQMMKKQYQEYNTLKTSGVKIQRYFRAWIAMRGQRNYYCCLKEMTLRMQHLYRANRAMKLKRDNFLKLKCAALVTQRKYRANQMMKKQVKEYDKMKTSAVKIQRYFRAWIAMRTQRSYYCSLKEMTSRIQQIYRANRAMIINRNNYMELKHAIFVIQRRYRANKMMKKQAQEYSIMKTSTLKIQRYFRAFIAMRTQRNYYCCLKVKTIRIQQLYRAKLAMKAATTYYNKLKSSVLFIQQKYRAQIKMKEDYNRFHDLKTAVIKVQQRFRGNVLAKRDKENYTNLRNATVIIQQKFRALRLMKQQRINYISLRRSTILVQQIFRAKKAMVYQRNRYLEIQKATVVLQRMYRAQISMQITRDSYMLLRKSTINIQRRFRANLRMRRDHERYCDLRKATMIIQRRYRANKLMKIEHARFQRLKNSVVAVQQRYRALIAMRQDRQKYCLIKSNVVILQTHIRAWRIGKACRIHYQQLCRTTLCIQQRFRANRMMKLQKQQYTRIKHAVIIIQTRLRAYLLMKKAKQDYSRLRQATLQIQQRFRANRLMKKSLHFYQSLKYYTLIVQRQFRANQLMIKDRADFTQLKESVILIQKHFRNRKLTRFQRNEFLTLRKHVIVIQQRYRALIMMNECRINYLDMKMKIVCVQRWWRTCKTRSEFIKIKQSVLVIQRRYRALILMRQERRHYLHLKNSVLIIQRKFRGYIKMNQERNSFIKKRRTTIIIQRYVRGFLVRQKYSHMLSDEAKEERRKIRTLSAAAIKIQALWRGHKSRSVENPKLEMIRQRSKDAQSRAIPENTLGHRCKQAVQLLINENVTLLQVLKVLEDLEYITRRCQTSCIYLSKTLSEHLYVMICSTSRSLPEMNACNLATHILINFCKYRETTEYSWQPEHMDKILTVMLHWCDKESFLFSSLCTLLWLFAHVEEYISVIKNIPNYQQRMAKIKNLCMRKYKMVSRVRVKGFSVFGYYGDLSLPSLKPDWGLDYKDKPKTFTNSMHALENLLKLLQF